MECYNSKTQKFVISKFNELIRVKVSLYEDNGACVWSVSRDSDKGLIHKMKCELVFHLGTVAIQLNFCVPTDPS